MIVKITDNLFKENYNKALKIKHDIDNEWQLCENGHKDCEEVFGLVPILEKEITNNLLSIFFMVDIFESKISRKEDQEYNVTKIYINEKLYWKMIEYDRKVLRLAHDNLTKTAIEREISMLHFVMGFAIDNSLKEDEVLLSDDVLRNKKG